MKAIAFYLPQYHKSIENDLWWGNNFTEWSLVKTAIKYYDFQEQPKIPLNSNYYDITKPEVVEWQIELAKIHKLFGFCIYHYWSNGNRLLRNGIDSFLYNNNSFPFAFCWANHDWTRQWQGSANYILQKQIYHDLDMKLHIEWLFNNVFNKSNYIRVRGKLLFVIFSVYNIPNLNDYITRLRIEASKYGESFYLICMLKSNRDAKIAIDAGFDNYVIRQPYLIDDLKEGINIQDYKNIMDHYLHDYLATNFYEIPNLFNKYDNTPRRKFSKSLIVKGVSPQYFSEYLTKLICLRKYTDKEEDFLFLTAWNEWGEGNYFEPCSNEEFTYLNCIKNILS